MAILIKSPSSSVSLVLNSTVPDAWRPLENIDFSVALTGKVKTL
jgi:hypothetical protein